MLAQNLNATMVIHLQSSSKYHKERQTQGAGHPQGEYSKAAFWNHLFSTRRI